MDTKWKNTELDLQLDKKSLKKPILGVVLILIGIVLALLYKQFIYGYFFNATSAEVWVVVAILNIFFTGGVALITDFLIDAYYKKRESDDTNFYREWNSERGTQSMMILFVGIAGCIFAWFYFYSKRYFFFNYAPGYAMVATAILQTLVIENRVRKFMNKRLDNFMARMDEINKKRLAEAIKIEKEGLAKAAKSEQLKVDLISNVSHDLKTPLTSMVGYIELLKKEELEDTQRDYVDVISAKAQQLKEMIESLFSLAKASSGNIELNMEELHLNMLVEQIFADLDDQIKDSQLTFVPLLTSEDTALISDNGYLYRIVQNLMENALKYSAKGTRVFVKSNLTWEDGEELIELSITNTAGYMMDFNKEDIVERFARGDKARTTEGNGLGLAIVSTYTSALGGTFDINIDCDQFKAILRFKKKPSIETIEEL